MAYLCGTEGYVKIDLTTNLEVLQWTASENAELSETTNTGDDGYKTNITCKKSMTGSVEANYDILLGPKNDPDITVGDLVALELHTGTGGQYDLTAHITRINWTVPAAASITWSFDFESTGPFAHT